MFYITPRIVFFFSVIRLIYTQFPVSFIYAQNIFAEWRSVGQTWLISAGAESRPGTDRVHRWFTASHEYADMNIREETINWRRTRSTECVTTAQTTEKRSNHIQILVYDRTNGIVWVILLIYDNNVFLHI